MFTVPPGVCRRLLHCPARCGSTCSLRYGGIRSRSNVFIVAVALSPAVRPCMSTGWAWAIPLPLGVPIAADLRACDAPTIAASCGSREAALGTLERKVPVASLLSAPDSLYVSVQIAGKSSSAFSAGFEWRWLNLYAFSSRLLCPCHAAILLHLASCIWCILKS